MKRKQEYRVCECGCGVSFKVGAMSMRFFASQACKQRAYRNRRKIDTGLTSIERVRICPVCGAQFIATSTKQIYDKVACRVTAYDRRKANEKKVSIHAV